MNTTFDRLHDLLKEKYSVDPALITPQATMESLGLDSLDFIELLFEVEDEFKIRVPEEGNASLRTATLQDMVDNIDQLVAANAASGAA